MIIDELFKIIYGHNIYIQMHNSPDPDAIASAYGLQQLLKYHNIDGKICCYGIIDKINARKMLYEFDIEVMFLDEDTRINDKDYIVLVDGQNYNNNITIVNGNVVGCIDHHPTVKESEYKYSDIRITGACASIIAEYFYKTKTEITTNVATALVYGIKVDTNNFIRGMTQLDIDMISKLFPKVDNKKIANLHNSTLELKDLKAYRAAIDSITIIDKVGFSYIPFDCEDALIGMISDFILSLDIVYISVVSCERTNGVKLSLRSKNTDIDAGKLLNDALEGCGTGGGHCSMAGGFIPNKTIKNIKSSKRELIEKLILNSTYNRKLKI